MGREHDDVELDIQAINPTQYLVSGNTSLDHFFDTFGIEYERFRLWFNPRGRLVLDIMNKIPEDGWTIRFPTWISRSWRRMIAESYRNLVNPIKKAKNSNMKPITD